LGVVIVILLSIEEQKKKKRLENREESENDGQDFNEQTKMYIEESKSVNIQDKIFEMDKTINLMAARQKTIQSQVNFIYIITMIGFICSLIYLFVLIVGLNK
jgi:hypothetical protein